jgi:hypothetical protein
MKSWEVLRDAIERIGVKAMAGKLNLSSALIYKWCQETSDDEIGGSGARNPLDRVEDIFEATDDERVINWICQQADGFFVRNPAAPGKGSQEEELLGSTQRVVQEFGELLTTISRSIENDGCITPLEADSIREAWEKLKCHAEAFVVACERGKYTTRRP